MIAKLSRHASERARQRGITEAQVNAVTQYADQSVHRGSGTEMIWISDGALRQLGSRTPEGVDIDRLKTLYLLVTNNSTVITLFRAAKRP